VDWLLTHLKEASHFLKSGTGLCQKSGKTQTFLLEKDAFWQKKFQNWPSAWTSAAISGGLGSTA
jgi:hypothetical protein